MKHMQRMGLAAAVVAVAGAWAPAMAADAAYPTKPVRLVVSFPPGGVADIMARDYGQALSQRWGQPVVVENRPGAGTTIAADVVAKSAPDGYTLYLTNIGHSISAAFYEKLNYDVLNDFEPITILADVPSVLVASASFPPNTVEELVKLAKEQPGSINYASAGNGTGSHLFAEHLKQVTGIEMVHVPYKGTAPAFADLVSGRVSLLFEPIGSILPHLAAGRVKSLGVSTAKRVPAAPDIPAIAESNLPDFNLSTWYGILAPKGVPEPLLSTVHDAFVAVTRTPAMQERLRAQGAEPVGNSRQAFAEIIRGDVERWKAVLAAGKPQ